MRERELCAELAAVDDQLAALFARRCGLSAALTGERGVSGGPEAAAAERAGQARFERTAGPELEDYAGVLYQTLLDIEHSRQAAAARPVPARSDRIAEALANTPKLFPQRAAVACQGVEGAYSQLAAEKLFREPALTHVASFEDVFAAISDGRCQYGVLPLENSTAGSVNRIYDLMMAYNFSIVRSARVKIDHSLLARPGVRPERIREIFSHEQAIAQCAGFLRRHPDVRVTACPNTAMAAKLVAESGRDDAAAISSRRCASLYGLDTLDAGIQDKGNNYTRFICIGRTLEIFPGADRTSVMLTIPHRPGSLYRIIARIAALGVNLTKLESRPLPDRDFEFMFYFDLDIPVYSPKLSQLIDDLETLCETFRYLGSYSEMI